jgi:hypothetical protein
MGPSAPGCLTSKDEERETWTAESLRVSIFEGFGFQVRDRTKDFGGTRFKGYTIAISDVNHGWLLAWFVRIRLTQKWWDLVKRCDQPV